MYIFEKLAEKKMQDALKNGDFDDLPGKGKPIILEDLYGVPPEDRMANKILKNAGVLPPQMSLRKEINELKKMILECESEQEKRELRKKLEEKATSYEILKERMRRRY